MEEVSICNGEIVFSNSRPFVLIAGPCALESRAHAVEVSAALQEITATRSVPFVYKTSFDKANRSSISGARGLGLKGAIPIFAELRSRSCPVLTDVHESWQCAEIASVVDILQIPAFLCRQTDLLVAAARTGLPINVKKGQLLAPWDMEHVAAKLSGSGGVLLCERGSFFGYNRLVVDMTSLLDMARLGHPVVMDATHAVQRPGGASTGGDRRYVPLLVRAACAVGVAGLFIETHPDPDKAPSDGQNMLYIKDLPSVLDMALEIDAVVKKASDGFDYGRQA